MSHLQRRIALLKQPPFFAYMLGFFFAAVGNGLGYIATSWLVVSVSTNKVAAMATLMACFWVPNVIVGPLMGVLADRLSRKYIIFVSNLFRGAVFIAASFYFKSHFKTIDAYLMMVGVGVAFSAFYASAFGFMRELVKTNDLMYANATVDVVYEAGNVIGMGIAGVLIAWTSAETAIFINGIAFLIATISVLVIPKKALCYGKAHEKRAIKIFADFKEGLMYLKTRKSLQVIYIIQLLILVTFLTTPLLLLPFSKTVLHTTVEQFGLIEAFGSIGIVIGGLFMPWFSEKYGLLRTILFFTVVLCITFALFGYNHGIKIAMLMYFATGFAGAVWPLIISKAQELTDLNFQGRVQSTFNSISGLVMVIFYFFVGFISKHIAVSDLYWIEFFITFLAVVFMLKSKKIMQHN